MNKIKLELYDNTKTYIYPDMSVATPERVQMDFAVVNVPNASVVITTDVSGMMFYEIEPLLTKAQRLGIDTSQYDDNDDLIIAMENILNTPQPEPEPSAEERIAAAMEFQNLLSM